VHFYSFVLVITSNEFLQNVIVRATDMYQLRFVLHLYVYGLSKEKRFFNERNLYYTQKTFPVNTPRHSNIRLCLGVIWRLKKEIFKCGKMRINLVQKSSIAKQSVLFLKVLCVEEFLISNF